MSYWPGLDLAGALAYVVFIFISSARLKTRGFPARQHAAVATLAQLPGFVFSLVAIYYWVVYGPLSSYFDFYLLFWHTPFMPFLSLGVLGEVSGFSIRYLLLYCLSPLYVLVFAGIPRVAEGCGCLYRTCKAVQSRNMK